MFMWKHLPAPQQQLCSQQQLMTNMQLHQLLHCCPSAASAKPSVVGGLPRCKQSAGSEHCMLSGSWQKSS
jgi:hypothetical protein